MRSYLTVAMVTAALIGSACLFGSEEVEAFTEQHRKVLSGEIEQLYDNGYRDGSDIILVPWEYSEDNFYLVESPDMLDSVFEVIEYPGIDTLFPEDGMLLILHFDNGWERILGDYSYSFSGDTVIVDLTVYDNPGPHNPVVWNWVFPIGVTLR